MFLARFGLATTVLVATAAVAPSVSAQCAFDQPNGSSSYVGLVSASLVRAFVSCNNPGGNTPNVAVLGGGVPGCTPVENYHQQAGSPAGGWAFAPGTSYGRVQIKRTSGGPNVGGYPTTARDAAVIIKMYHIDRADGGPGFASGHGVVQVIFRATFNDYDSGDTTSIDFPLGVGFTLSGGSVSITKKVGDLLVQGLGIPRFPDCTTLEVVSIAVKDPNGNIFAVPGVKFQ
jgi:hypothetical protein